MDYSSKFVIILQTSLLAIFLILVYIGVSFFLYLRRVTWIFKGAKGPPECHWLFGSFRAFPLDGHERTMHFLKLGNTYGKEQGYVLLWSLFRKPIIMVCCPRLMGKICKSSEPKAKGIVGVYRFLKPWLGEGLLVANGERWARNRRLLTPAFHFEILKPYTAVFNKSANILVKKLSIKAEAGERFEVFQNVCLCTLDIILKCAFSYDKDVQNAGDTNPYVKAVNRITDSIQYRFLTPLLFWDFFWYHSTVGKQFKADCDFVHGVAEDIIDSRKQTLDETELGKQRYIDFLDILLTAKDEEGKGLTRMEIRNEVDTFLFEGHDTTASGIAWILYSLAENPDIQQKCQEEINEVLEGRETDDLEWSDLGKLEYLTMCIKEGMRLHSPVPIVTREASQDFDLGDRVAPKGSLIQINIWVMNHMTNYWGEDHMEFKPERFSKDNLSKIEPFQYVPFSAGPRNCIGQNFAMNEEKVVLSKLLRNFTFTLDKSHVVRKNVSAVMRTKDGIFMFAEKRSR